MKHSTCHQMHHFVSVELDFTIMTVDRVSHVLDTVKRVLLPEIGGIPSLLQSGIGARCIHPLWHLTLPVCSSCVETLSLIQGHVLKE